MCSSDLVPLVFSKTDRGAAAKKISSAFFGELAGKRRWRTRFDGCAGHAGEHDACKRRPIAASRATRLPFLGPDDGSAGSRPDDPRRFARRSRTRVGGEHEPRALSSAGRWKRNFRRKKSFFNRKSRV